MKRNKFFSKRRLASFVALVLSVNTLSVTAWAGSFSQLQDLIDANGNVVLGEDYTYDAEKDSNGHTTININKDVKLDLNGWTISGGSNEKGENGNGNSVITVGHGGNLTLQDSRGEAEPTHTETTPAPVGTGDDAETPKVGTITGGSGGTGAGVKVVDGGTFVMESGTITGNYSNGAGTGSLINGGGGVFVGGEDSSFTMNGGKITGNTSNGSGAGVYVDKKATFTMNKGEITGNTSNGGDGAGVMVRGGNFTMNDGTIGGNYASGTQKYIGNVRVWGGNFTMNGGTMETSTALKPNSVGCSLVAGHNPSNGDSELRSSFVEINGGTLGDKVYFDNPQQETDGTINWKVNTPYYVITEKDSNQTVNIKRHTCNSDVSNNDGKPATCTDTGLTESRACSICGAVTVAQVKIKKLAHTEEVIPGKAATCTETGLTDGTKCSVCDTVLKVQEEIKAKGHTEVTVTGKAATCTEAGLTDGTKCSVCNIELVAQKVIEATGHHFGEWSWNEWVANEAGTEQTRTGTRACVDCGFTETDSQREDIVNPGGGEDSGSGDDNTGDTGDTGDTGTTEPETPAEGGTFIPDDETPLAADPTAAPAADADTTVITDEPIPLAGLITRAQLLAELYRYEQRPEVVLPEEFDFAEHEYALAICWGLDNALETHTEDDPYLPDDLLTVGVLREVLVNFVAYKGIEDLEFTVEGEDDELVMDLDVRLAAFYELLEAAEA